MDAPAPSADDDEAQIIHCADGGEARRVTSLSTGVGVALVSDPAHRLRLAVADLKTDKAQAKRIKTQDDKVKVHIAERAEYRFWDHWLTDGREPHVFVADIATGRARDLLAGTRLSLQPWEPSNEHFDISPDGRELAITADLAPEQRMMNESDIVAINLVTGRHRTLTAESTFSDDSPRYSPDGRHLLWRSHNVKRAFNDQGRLTLFDRRTGKTRRLAARLDRATAHARWAPDSSAIYALIEDRGRVGLYRLGLADAMPSEVAAGGTLVGFDISADGNRIVFGRADLSSPVALFAARGKGTGASARFAEP